MTPQPLSRFQSALLVVVCSGLLLLWHAANLETALPHGVRKFAARSPHSHGLNPEHSLLHCKRAEDYRDRICHLEHVCWDTVDRTWVFFEDNSSRRSQTFVSSEFGVVPLRNISSRLVQLRREEEPYEVPLPLRVELGFHPAARAARALGDATDGKHSFSTDPSSVHVVFESFWAENFGHAVGDDIFPAFFLLRTFGFVPDKTDGVDAYNVQLLSLQRPSWRLGPLSSEQAQRGARQLDNFARLLFKSPILDMQVVSPWNLRDADAFKAALDLYGGDDYIPPGSHPPNPSSPRFVCVRHLLAGHSRTGMHFDNGAAWPHFVSASLQGASALWPSVRAAIHKDLSSLPPLILILEKKGRRRVINHDDIVSHLKKAFPQASVESVDPALLSFADQISLAQQVAVLVSPCGGISFFAMFLRSGSSAIFLGYWDDASKRSVNMEGWLWRHLPGLHELYYDVYHSEIFILPPGNASRASWDDYRNHGSLLLDTKRLEVLVASALHTSEHSMGLGSS